MADKQTTQQDAPHPQDLVLDTLTAVVKPVNALLKDPEAISKDLVRYFTASLPSKPDKEDPPDICSKHNGNTAGVVTPLCAQLDFDKDTARSTYDTSNSEAEHKFKTALGQWNLANSQYRLSVTKATQTYQSAVDTARKAFTGKTNLDSDSREKNLYYQLEKALAAALITFEGAKADAAMALGAAAGALVQGYMAYVTAVGTASAQQISDRANALAKFWAAVESGLDAV